MLIKELLKHVYPSCKVKVFYLGEPWQDYTVQELYTKVVESDVDGVCNNWAVYQDCLAIFLD